MRDRRTLPEIHASCIAFREAQRILASHGGQAFLDSDRMDVSSHALRDAMSTAYKAIKRAAEREAEAYRKKEGA